MATAGRRIRAALGMGILWGAAWAIAGGVLARVPGLDPDLPLPLLFAPLGFVSGIMFSAILAGIEARRSRRTSLLRFAGWGAASGLLLSGIFVAGAALRGATAWGEFLLFGPPLALASAACAAGSLAMARRAERRALPADTTRPVAGEVTGGDASAARRSER